VEIRDKDSSSSIIEKSKDISREKPLWEKILMFFPGYKGYKEKEILRETDKLVRDTVARHMKEVALSLREVFRNAVSTIGLAPEVKTIEKLSMRCDMLSEKIKHLEYGYTPLGYVVKVDEEKLNKLTSFDASLVDYIHNTKDLVNSLRDEVYNGKIETTTVRKLEEALNNLESLVNARKEVLLGMVR